MNKEQIKKLAEARGFPKISIYFPTHEKGPEVQQDPVRLKNCLSSAREQLEVAGIESREIDSLLADADARTAKGDFWLHQSAGLAVLIDGAETRWHRLPEPVEEFTSVGERFHIRPLLQIFEAEDSFYILALNRDENAFYEATRHALSEHDVKDCPESIAAFRHSVDFENNVHFHANAPSRASGGAEGAPQYHAQGESPDDYEDVVLEQYIKQVAKAIDGHLSTSEQPLVLAGDPRLIGRFRACTHYRAVTQDAVAKNPQSMDQEELHAAARQVASQHSRPASATALERLEMGLSDEDTPASDELEELVSAAADGRVETLFIDPEAHVWGRYDHASRRLSIESQSGAGNEDLLDLMAANTLVNGGEVFALPEEKARSAGPAAAVMRYPAANTGATTE
jgi:hypothetical protein